MSVDAAQAAHRAASDAEWVAWVDADDQLLGSLPRAELRERGLIARASFVLLFNAAGELCVHRRTLSKAVYPGYWDVAAGGMVQAGESYQQSAARELHEELGVTDAQLTSCGRFFFAQDNNRLWGEVFQGVSEQPLRLQPEEVMEARFISIAAALAEAEQKPYCPDSLLALQQFLAD
jgi:isopentenyldiphosphate isomerase